jgi:hypothetical protein
VLLHFLKKSGSYRITGFRADYGIYAALRTARRIGFISPIDDFDGRVDRKAVEASTALTLYQQPSVMGREGVCSNVRVAIERTR